jgi:hypothetical protein
LCRCDGRVRRVAAVTQFRIGDDLLLVDPRAVQVLCMETLEGRYLYTSTLEGRDEGKVIERCDATNRSGQQDGQVQKRSPSQAWLG